MKRSLRAAAVPAACCVLLLLVSFPRKDCPGRIAPRAIRAAYTIAFRDVTPAEFAAVHPDEKLIEARLQVSTLISRGSEDDLAEYFYRAASPRQSLEIVDYLPKTTLAGDLAGNLSVEKHQEQSAGIGLSLSGVYPHTLKSGLSAEIGGKSRHHAEVREVAAPRIARRQRHSRPRQQRFFQTAAFGAHFARRWQRVCVGDAGAGALAQRLSAFALPGGRFSPGAGTGTRRTGPTAARVIFSSRSTRAATRPLKMPPNASPKPNTALRRLAQSYSHEIGQRASPPLAHRLSRMLSGGDPQFPKDWLAQLLFDPEAPENGRIVALLPHEVRQAAHRYFVAQRQMYILSGQ